MLDASLALGSSVVIAKTELNALLQELILNGYQTIGPSFQDGSIVYKEIRNSDELPIGMNSTQSPAKYNLAQSDSGRYFDFIPGADSWKRYLFPPKITLFSAERSKDWQISSVQENHPKYAFLGVRACELAAILIQDSVFIRSDYQDPIYQTRREDLLIIAVNCLDPDETCFCQSMGTGPQVGPGYDLCLTELKDTFLVMIGSELGRTFISSTQHSIPSAFVQNSAAQEMAAAQASITRSMNTENLPEILSKCLESDRWDEIGKRCLSCTSCTMVCPTCFCWDTIDHTNISLSKTSRERVWDSCFNPGYSYVFGGNTRPNIRSRYRQWLTHKLGTWKDQFGTLGCVGCGRCITWCPAGIDITEEVSKLRNE